MLPTLSRLRAGGRLVRQAHVTSVPTLTAVGHANLGTGAEPQTHGLAVNYLFNRVTGNRRKPTTQLDPGEMMALTLADVWNIQTEGKAVIVGQGGAIRAMAGLVGHGGCLLNGRPVPRRATARRRQLGDQHDCYAMPEALTPLNARPTGPRPAARGWATTSPTPKQFRHSALFETFEGDALAAVLEAAPIGADDVTDLVLVNLKGPDYVGHAYGPASPEIKAELAELDGQIARALEIIERKAGAGRFVLAFAADHGMPGEPRPGGRHYIDDIAQAGRRPLLARRRHGGAVLQRRGQQRDPPRYREARALSVSLRDVAAFLEAEVALRRRLTEDEVRAAQVRLGAAGR